MKSIFLIIQCVILTLQNGQFENAVSNRYVNCLVLDSFVQNYYFDPPLYTKLEFFCYHDNNKKTQSKHIVDSLHLLLY